MRICVISTSVFRCPPDGYSGLEMIAWHCAKGLAELGHKVSLVAPEGSFCPGVEIIYGGKVGTWDEHQSYDQYWKRLMGFDAIIDHTWQKNSYMLKAEGVLKCPILGVMHAPVDTMYQMLPPVENPCLVCISQDQAWHFEALHNREARTCYNGVDSEVYKDIGVGRTDRFLFCGRFSSIKGPLIAIKACKEAGVGLDLIGDTSITNEPDYFNACMKEADGEQIRIVGPQSRGGCVWWMSRAHAFLHSAKDFREPFGLAPVEAQLCGLPVVSFDNGAMRETIRNGVTGTLVKKEKDFVQAVKQISSAVVFKGDMEKTTRNDCREWAKQFSIERMCKRYEELCSEAVEKGGW